jgi:hypothetical protein
LDAPPHQDRLSLVLVSFLGRKPAAPAAGLPRLLAFFDYGYLPHALGDTLTCVENVQIAAREARASEVDIVVLASRERPAPSWQPFITAHHHVSSVHGLLPAFLSSSLVRDVHLIEDRQFFYAMISGLHRQGVSMWPPVAALTAETIDFMSHMKAVEHFRRAGSIPLLSAPRGYAEKAHAFVARFCAGRFRVVVNIRQSHLKSSHFQPERDSQFETWAQFIIECAKRYPDVIFIVTGRFSDVDRRFERLPATIVPRSWGHGLGVELSLLQDADLFMGTSSGFSQAALFGHPAYIVTNTEPRAAAFCGVPVGARHHPFGRPDQIVTWSRETVESLMSDFEAVLTVKASKGQVVPSCFA